MKFGTKAETLERLSRVKTTFSILPQYRFTVRQFSEAPDNILESIPYDLLARPVIIRSSAINEDTAFASNAGAYESVLNVTGRDQIKSAIAKVHNSLNSVRDQIFIQPMVNNPRLSGVIFSVDPGTSAPYRVVNFDDKTGRTDSVTAGDTNDLRTFFIARCISTDTIKNESVRTVVTKLDELESLFARRDLDVEFAIDAHNVFYVLQVRPLAFVDDSSGFNQQRTLHQAQEKIARLFDRHPYLCGSTSLLGVMPDWNPAEIIGIRPKPLALSLYRALVTDQIWAYQRSNYGYRNLRSFPLLVDLAGLPYVDVRTSFNSFIPADLDESIAEDLVNHYISELADKPKFHDKIEFEVILSCYVFDIDARADRTLGSSLSLDNFNLLKASLKKLTNNIIKKDGLWKQDLEKVELLIKRQDIIINSNLETIEKIYWLIEDCKRYGTLPFAGLARAAFIATQFLDSMVTTRIISDSEKYLFLSSLNTVSSELQDDLLTLSKAQIIEKYGHLRPGTYDICSKTYEQNYDFYFSDLSGGNCEEDQHAEFVFSDVIMGKIECAIKKHGLEQDSQGLLEFIKKTIEGRERAKFIFSRSLSLALELIADFGKKNAVSREDIAFSSVDVIYDLYSSSELVYSTLITSIALGKQRYSISERVVLPAVISSTDDVYQFEQPQSTPNFVSLKQIQADVAVLDGATNLLRDKIVFIENADPGYDWIFSQGIKGLVTKFGGVNSHMAVRCAELSLPAVIGAGDSLYSKWSAAKTLIIDCANRKVTKVI